MREPSMLLVGGWGYGNLGDEAILKGYIETIAALGMSCGIGSVDRRQTELSQGFSLPKNMAYFPEWSARWSARKDSRRIPVIAGGGGYLNGSWRTEVASKIQRIRILSGPGNLRLHGVEARALVNDKVGKLFSGAIAPGMAAVRDDDSVRVMESLGVQASVVPDSISLLAPIVHKIARPLPMLQGCTLLNLLDINKRYDSKESEVIHDNWVKSCRTLASRLGKKCVGLAIDSTDAEFLSDTVGVSVIRATTVSGLVSILASCDALVSVRMHPALISSMLGTPTVAIPYCGKVRPTLAALDLGWLIPESDRIEEFVSYIPDDMGRATSIWNRNSAASLHAFTALLG